MNILVCGARDWTDGIGIHSVLAALKDALDDVWIIEGEARGADRLAGASALVLGLPVFPYPARWAQEGPAAGPIRNQRMLTEGKPDRVYAFHDNLMLSKGTRHMVGIARKAGIPVWLCQHRERDWGPLDCEEVA